MTAGVGFVLIGRNEGERLVRCLRSLPKVAPVVYVDSGSTDGSVERAKEAGAIVVQLDMGLPFTAARARNAGRRALPTSCRLIQFVDGDCALQPGWLEAGIDALEADPRLAAVFGRRREIDPGGSWYNWICDIEWAVKPGPASYFGGDVLIRAEALDDAGGYPDEMIAGEEPDLSLRLRARGWALACLPNEMTLHDAAIYGFSQWWCRAVRSGHAYAELATRHAGSPLQNYSRRLCGSLFWGLAIPGLSLLLLFLALLLRNVCFAILAGGVQLLPLAQIARLTLREHKRLPMDKALILAFFLSMAKPAQSFGFLRYWRGRISGKRSTIIEYKARAPSTGREPCAGNVRDD